MHSFAHSPDLAQPPAPRRCWTLIRRTRFGCGRGSRRIPLTRQPLARPRLPGHAAPPLRAPASRARAHAQGSRRPRRGARGRGRPLPPPLAAHAGNPSPRLLRLRRSVVAMDSPWNELTLAFSRTSMFPFFDIAHYLVSVMALKHQPGECWAPRIVPLRDHSPRGRPELGERPSCLAPAVLLSS